MVQPISIGNPHNSKKETKPKSLQSLTSIEFELENKRVEPKGVVEY